jgi:hypothetical protein
LLLAQHPVQEVLHGQQIREEGFRQSRREHARDETRQVEKRVGKESDQPQASHRHRPLRSATRGREGAVEEVLFEEIERKEVVEEAFLVQEIELEEIHFEEIGEEEVATG